MNEAVLRHFRLSASHLLGQGGESHVYALDSERVLRIYHEGVSPEYLRRRHDLYDRLRAASLSFEVPEVERVEVIEGTCCTVEKRMRGRDFEQALPALSGSARQKAMKSYLCVSGQIGEVRFPESPFGERLASSPIQATSWPSFLLARTQRTLEESRPDVEEDVPQFKSVWRFFQQELRIVEGMEEKRLVHGDLYPGNVFMDEEYNICGVGDFSYTTLVGDPRLDAAGAVVFLELSEGYRETDTAFLLDLLVREHGAEIKRIVRLYRLYYSFFFSYCKPSDRKTYDWCIGNLKGCASGLG